MSFLCSRVLAVALLLAAAFPARLLSQSRAMTITGMSGMQLTSYDESSGIASYSVNFTVKNTGTQAAYVYAWQDCGSFCSAAGPWSGVWTYATPNQTVTVPVWLSVPDYPASSTGTVSLNVAGMLPGNQFLPGDVGYASVNVSNGTATFLTRPRPSDIVVTPTGTIAKGAGWQTLTFAVTNNANTPLPAVLTLAVKCGGYLGYFEPATEVWSSCGQYAPSTGQPLLNEQTNSPVSVVHGTTASVPITIWGANGQRGYVRLIRSMADPATNAMVTDTTTVFVLAGEQLAPDVTPKATALYVAPRLARVDSFTVRNTGTVAADYALTTNCGTFAWKGCSVSPSAVSLSAGASVRVGLSYTPAAANGATSAVKVIAVGTAAGVLAQSDTGSITVTTRDVGPPAIVVTPAQSVTVNTQSVTATVNLCDDGIVANPVVTFNGVPLPDMFLRAAQSGCATAGTSTFTLAAQPGTNTLVVSAADDFFTSSLTRSFTYNDATEVAPQVAAVMASVNVPPAMAWTDTFTVRNPGPVAATYAVTASCGAFGGCSAQPSSVTIAAGAIAKVVAAYTSPTSAGATATIQVTASHTSSTGQVASASANLSATVVAGALTQLAMTPAEGATYAAPGVSASVTWCDPDDAIASRQVWLGGVLLPDTFVPETVAGCASAGTSTWTSLTLLPWSQMLLAQATDAAGHVTRLGHTLDYTPSLSAYAPLVTPKNIRQSVTRGVVNSIAFAVTNSGAYPATYTLSASCGAFTVCRASKQSMTLAPGARDSAQVSFLVPSAIGAFSPIRLIARYSSPTSGTIADSGQVTAATPTAAELFQPKVTVSPPLMIMLPGWMPYLGYTIRNMGAEPVTYALAVSMPNDYSFTPTHIPMTSVTLGPGESTLMDVQPRTPYVQNRTDAVTVTASYLASDGTLVSASDSSLITLKSGSAAVAVTPQIADATVWRSSGMQFEQFFQVRNSGSVPLSVVMSAQCDSLPVRCTTSDTSVNLSEGASRQVAVRYYVGDFQRGHIRFIASSGYAGQNVSSQGFATVRIGDATYKDVRVSPDSVEVSVPVGDGQRFFTIVNAGGGPATYRYTTTCESTSGQAAFFESCAGAVVDRMTETIPASGSATVGVAYRSSTTLGLKGKIRIVVTDLSDPTISARGVAVLTTANLRPIVVDVATVGATTTVARDQCLTIAVGGNGAYECGDLRLVHVTSATKTMGKTRAPTLIYNSRHHSGVALFPANVAIQSGFPAYRLEATVVVGSQTWTEAFDWRAEWSDGTPRRIVVPVNLRSWSLATGAYPYTMSVRAVSATSSLATQGDGIVAFVNRSTTQFGPGWWLDGYEQIVNYSADTTQKVWIGGDGSVRLYTLQGQNVWRVTPAVDRPDSLTWSNNHFYRWLSGDAYVEFNNNGFHTATRNAQAQITRFDYENPYRPFWLTSVTLPVPVGSTQVRKYEFVHDDYDYVTRIEAPTQLGQSQRRTTLGFFAAADGSSVLHTITDPDGRATTYDYDALVQVQMETDRGRTATRFWFGEGGALDSSRVDMGATAPYKIVRAFCASETVSRSNCSKRVPIDTVSVQTRYAGPRTDVPDTTWFQVTRYGAPARIVTASLDTTLIERTDSKWPLLATGVVRPNAHRITTSYDATHALPLFTTDHAPYGGADATTSYEWDTKWRKATAIILPSPGGSTRFAYDPATGDRLWQKDGRGDSTKTYFYYTNRRLDSLIAPKDTQPGRRTTYKYDALGNLTRIKTPSGMITRIVGDYLGRDSVVYGPVIANDTITRTEQTFSYDVLDHVLRTRTSGPATVYTVDAVSGNGQADWLEVTNQYDDDTGDLRLTSRVGSGHVQPLVMQWTYDAIGRKLTERNHAGYLRAWTYDPAGNVLSDSSPRANPLSGAALVVRMTYDAVNRLKTRITPSVTYPKESCISACAGFPGWLSVNASTIRFPYFEKPRADGESEQNVVLPADTARFTYDRLGNLVTADNRDAKVYREYFPNGALKLDSLRIGVYDRVETPDVDPFTRHGYALRYTYDPAGHRVTRTDRVPTLPSNTQSYAYDAGSGALTSTTDIGTTATFKYDAESRLGRLTTGNWFVETRDYDDDDLLKHRLNNIYDDVLQYDGRGKVVDASITSGLRPGLSEHRRMAYSGMGALIVSSRARGGTTWTDEYEVDGYANVLVHESNRFDVQQHRRYTSDVVDGQSLSSMLLIAPDSAVNGTAPPAPLRHLDNTFYEYDAAGNQTKTAVAGRAWSTTPANLFYEPTLEGSSWTRSYYDAENRLRVFQETGYPSTANGFPRRTTFVEYRYDALGRRVLMRTQRDTSCVQTSCSSAFDKLSVIDRFVWDGDQMLYEFRAAADYSTHGVALESEITAGTYTGSVHYMHAGGIDQPLALWRDGNSGFIPHLSWRGGFEAVSRIDGTDPQIYMPAADREPYLGADVRQSSPREENYWLGSLVTGKMDLSGLMYMRNRYYDPKAGRFTQEDPIGLAGGMNLYGFAAGDPVNLSDPFGLVTCPPICVDNRDGLGWARVVGVMVRPAQKPLEIAGMVVTAPLGGEMGMRGKALSRAAIGKTAAVAGAAARTAAVTDRVIGHYPAYAQVAEAMGMKYFSIPTEVWNGMSETAQWAANRQFLNEGIAAGAEFVLATRQADIRAGSFLVKEVAYLLKHGYKWADDKLSLIPK